MYLNIDINKIAFQPIKAEKLKVLLILILRQCPSLNNIIDKQKLLLWGKNILGISIKGKRGLIMGSSMVPPWFLHGLSIDLGVFDGGTMEEAWTNHGGSTFESPIYRVEFYGNIQGNFIPNSR